MKKKEREEGMIYIPFDPLRFVVLEWSELCRERRQL